MSELILPDNTLILNPKMLLSLDPGKQTGIALGYFGDNHPYELIKVWQISDGITGFLKWWNSEGVMNIKFREWQYKSESIIVCEKFILRSNQFVADTEPLLIEGALQALWHYPIIWQQRSDKTLVEDSTLKAHGLWHTGKQVGWKDARDTNDAIIHALGYLKKNKHVPTLKKYWKET
jgi:hypothetical protein